MTTNFASAATVTQAAADQRFATEFGQTLPPVGFVRYCIETPAACEGRTILPQKISLSADRWQMLMKINEQVNFDITAISDQELHGVPERWSMPINNKGDCEDYVLLKKQKLVAAGFHSSALKITVVLDEEGNGHAVLTAVTTNGDFVLDNRRDDIRRWKETKYTFLKRQSDGDPKQWMALIENKTTSFGALSASQSH